MYTCICYTFIKSASSHGHSTQYSTGANIVFSLNIRHQLWPEKFVAIRIGMNTMAKADKYLDYLDETLERAAKPWSALLGAVLETKWRVLNSLYGQQFEGYHVYKDSWALTVGKNSSATKSVPMNTRGTLWL